MQNHRILDELLDDDSRSLLDTFAHAPGLDADMILMLAQREYTEPGSGRRLTDWTITAVTRSLAYDEFAGKLSRAQQVAVWAPRQAGEVFVILARADGINAVGAWPASTSVPFRGRGAGVRDAALAVGRQQRDRAYALADAREHYRRRGLGAQRVNTPSRSTPTNFTCAYDRSRCSGSANSGFRGEPEH